MELPIAEWMEAAGVRSKDELARKTLNVWKEDSKEKVKIKPRSLAAKIGELERGARSWWARRPAAAEALAQVLEIDVADLRLEEAEVEQKEGGLIGFEEFLELRPLDPLREHPLDFLDATGWFSTVETPTWFRAPAGAGKRLALRWHVARGDASGVEADTLTEAAEKLNQAEPAKHYVVVVHRPDPEHDAAALRQLGRREHVMVLAPFHFPRDAGYRNRLIQHLAAWHGSVNESDVQAWERINLGPWNVREWSPNKDWREQFLRWVFDRVPSESLFDPDSLQEWLESNDPLEKKFQTPGDLLPLCRYVHLHGEARLRELAEHELPDEWIKARWRDTQRGTEERTRWLRAEGLRHARHAVEQHFLAPSLPWHGALTEEEWVALLPHDGRPAAEQSIKELVDKESEGAESVLEYRERLHASIPRMARVQGRQAFEHLVDCGVFRSVGSDRWAFGPDWVADAWAEKYLRSEHDRPSPLAWGRLAWDRDRLPLVDRSLDRITPDALAREATALVAGFDPAQPGWAAAAEALFAAAGRRRLGNSSPDLSKAPWTNVGDLVLSIMVRHNGVLSRVPSASRGPLEWTADISSWIASCWSWSLSTPAPDEASPVRSANWATFFPGWHVLAPQNLVGTMTLPTVEGPERLDFEKKARVVDPEARRALKPLLKLAGAVLDRCPAEVLPDNLHPLFLPAAVLRALKNGSAPRPPHVEGILKEETLETAFLEGLNLLQPADRVAAADALLGAGLALGRTFQAALLFFTSGKVDDAQPALGPDGQPRRRISRVGSDRQYQDVQAEKAPRTLVGFVTRHVRVETVLAAVAQSAGDLTTVWAFVPRRLQRAVLEWGVANDPRAALGLLERSIWFDEDVPFLVDLATAFHKPVILGTGHGLAATGTAQYPDVVTSTITWHLWERSPTEALRIVVALLPRSGQWQDNPFLAQRPDALERHVLDFLDRSVPSATPAWAPRWLRQRLNETTDVELVYALIMKLSSGR